MNERTAQSEGLIFTGITAQTYRDYELAEIKQRAAEIRALGFRAVIVQSGKSEWGGGCKVLYADENFHIYKIIKAKEQFIENYQKRKNDLKEEYEKKLQELEDELKKQEQFVKTEKERLLKINSKIKF